MANFLIVKIGSINVLDIIFKESLEQLKKNNTSSSITVLIKSKEERKVLKNFCHVDDVIVWPGFFGVKTIGFLEAISLWVRFLIELRKVRFDNVLLLYDNYIGSGYLKLELFILAIGAKTHGIYYNTLPKASLKFINDGSYSIYKKGVGVSIYRQMCRRIYAPLSLLLFELLLLFFGLKRRAVLSIKNLHGNKGITLPERLKILFIIDTLEVGGNQEIEYLNTKYLTAKGHKVFFITVNPGLYNEKMKLAGAIDVLTLEKARVCNADIYFNIGIVREIYRYIKQNEIDVVQMCLVGSYLLGVIPTLIANVPVILGMETSGDIQHPSRSWQSRVIKNVARFIDGFYADSYKELKELSKHKIKKSKINVIPTGIDLKKYDIDKVDIKEVKTEFGFSERDLIIGTVCRFEPRKGIGNLIQAANKILMINQNVKLLLVGDGKIKSDLEQIVINLGITSNIIFTGFREDVPRLIAAMDIFCMPSVGDTMSSSILQAMAMKKPVISGEAREYMGLSEPVINNVTGLVVPDGDVEGIIVSALDLINDKKKRKKMGEAGYKIIREKFTLETMGEKTEQLFYKSFR